MAAVLAASLGACTGEEPRPLAPAPLSEVKARLEHVSGDVRVKRSAGDDWMPATERQDLYENDKVRTARGAQATLRFMNGSALGLSEDALIGIAETRSRPGQDKSDVTVLKGRVDAELKDPDRQSLSVNTPAATVRAGREIAFQ